MSTLLDYAAEFPFWVMDCRGVVDYGTARHQWVMRKRLIPEIQFRLDQPETTPPSQDMLQWLMDTTLWVKAPATQGTGEGDFPA
ncbi:hypothetical protein IWQ61_002714 [Dispira simplex]|nr:hypothetical protein IWQ61_002714 [Dispira simplex]